MTRFCENCGAQIAEGKKFCINCGTKVEEQQPAPPAQQQPPQQQPMQQQPMQAPPPVQQQQYQPPPQQPPPQQYPQQPQPPQQYQNQQPQYPQPQPGYPAQSQYMPPANKKRMLPLILIISGILVLALVALVIFVILPAVNGSDKPTEPTGENLSVFGQTTNQPDIPTAEQPDIPTAEEPQPDIPTAEVVEAISLSTDKAGYDPFEQVTVTVLGTITDQMITERAWIAIFKAGEPNSGVFIDNADLQQGQRQYSFYAPGEPGAYEARLFGNMSSSDVSFVAMASFTVAGTAPSPTPGGDTTYDLVEVTKNFIVFQDYGYTARCEEIINKYFTSPEWAQFVEEGIDFVAVGGTLTESGEVILFVFMLTPIEGEEGMFNIELPVGSIDDEEYAADQIVNLLYYLCDAYYGGYDTLNEYMDAYEDYDYDDDVDIDIEWEYETDPDFDWDSFWDWGDEAVG